MKIASTSLHKQKAYREQIKRIFLGYLFISTITPFFKNINLCFSVDATFNHHDKGRMINDAAPGDSKQNSEIKVVNIERNPCLCIFASKDIEIGEEIRYDYGVEDLPWRKVGNREFLYTLYKCSSFEYNY